MKELVRTLEEWRDRADARCGLKEQAAYQRVIDEIEARQAKRSVIEENRTELNWEHYSDELMTFLSTYLAMRAQDETATKCGLIECGDCLFSELNDGRDADCADFTREWLLSPYKPYKPVKKQPTLTRKDRIFLEMMERIGRGWVVRDKNESLWFYDTFPEPKKNRDAWVGIVPGVWLRSEEFSFIRWEDEKPWNVADLLELEVESEDA